MQKGYPWPGIAPTSGPDAGRYLAPEWWAVWCALNRGGGVIIPDAVAPLRTDSVFTNRGVYYSIKNRLHENYTGGLGIEVYTGAALVDGQFYYNEATLTMTLPANSTVYLVVRKNFTAAAYTPPGYTAGDGVVPAYATRVTWVAAVTQDTDRVTYWDIPLTQYVSGAAGFTSKADLREYIDARTTYIWVSPDMVYNFSDSTEIPVSITANFPAWAMPDNKVSIAYGRVAVPGELISGIAIDAIWVWTGVGTPNIYVRTAYAYAACGTAFIPAAGSWTAQTLDAANVLTCFNTTMTLAFANSGDVLYLVTDRDATDMLDTANATVYFIGWRVSFSVYA